MIYAGIGARATPTNILVTMTKIATHLRENLYDLRSGGARGADMAFEAGASFRKEIFRANDTTKDALLMAEQDHPAWAKLNPYVRQLMGRNAMILLGQELDAPVEMVICWTPDGKIIGGTGHSLRIAMRHKIPIYNLALGEDLHALRLRVGKAKLKTRED